jgi:hypothetical protein
LSVPREAWLPNCTTKSRSCISQRKAASHRFDGLKATAVKVEQAAPPAFEHCVRALKNFASAPSYVATSRAGVASTQHL